MDLKVFKDKLNNVISIIDEMIDAEEREDKGEVIDKKEQEALLGRFMLALVELQSM